MPAYYFDKHHLVPFGEFVPPGFRWFINLMNIPLGDFNRGAVGQPPFEWRGERLAPNICYEDLFGEELGQVKRALQRRLVLHAVVMCSVVLGLGLGGVALLLWAVTPPAQIHAPWALVLAPLPPLAVAAWCLRAAAESQRGDSGLFANLRQQMAVDRALLAASALSPSTAATAGGGL